MSIVYGYFKSEEQAREAARRCEELGITSAILTNMDPGSYVDESVVPHTMRRREFIVIRSGIIGAAVFGIIGLIVWFLIPALSSKVFLAGPLMMAMYGAAIGVGIGMWLPDKRHHDDEVIPSEVRGHADVDRVVVVNIQDRMSTENVERMLEEQGAVEVIHRAA